MNAVGELAVAAIALAAVGGVVYYQQRGLGGGGIAPPQPAAPSPTSPYLVSPTTGACGCSSTTANLFGSLTDLVNSYSGTVNTNLAAYTQQIQSALPAQIRQFTNSLAGWSASLGPDASTQI